MPPLVAPTKVLIVPLSAKEEFDPLIQEVCKFTWLSHRKARANGIAFNPCLASKLRKAGVFARVDDSNTSIGKRYARNDELGTPFGVTLDFACDCFFFFFHFTPICTSHGLIRPLFFASITKQDDDASVSDLWAYRMIHLAGFERKVLTIIIQKLRERDTMMQLIGQIDDVIRVVTALVEGDIDWAEACRRLPAYEGVQAV